MLTIFFISSVEEKMQLNTQEQREYRSLKRKAFGQFLLIMILCLVLIANVCGLIVGGIIYKETSLFDTHRNSQRFNNLKQVMETGKQQKSWQDVKLTSQFGYPLAGTYIPNPQPTDKTLIFLHGFSDSRLAGLHYIRLYFAAGYNLLLVDQRAHGDSGGSSITWDIMKSMIWMNGLTGSVKNFLRESSAYTAYPWGRPPLFCMQD